MKKFIFFSIVIFTISCTSNQKPTPKMPGAYFMISQTINDGSKDTKLTDLKQLKIYTEDMMMYTQVNPIDSVSGFGLGSYTADTGTVVEKVIYSASDTTINTPNTYYLNIATSPQGYTQVIPDIMVGTQKSKLTEEYQSVGKAQTTPLDGLWKETDFYIVKGTDTARSQRTQYKAFYAGYFMYGHTLKDSANKTFTGVGFGTFEMNGKDQIKETDLNSTYSIAVGQSFMIGLEITDADHYKQTIVSTTDGSKSVEFYERVKK
ncbi:MAG: hypothetical protein M3139_05330 [Bacteroidota bacterium]|nr:hypothetical protein [Bacteroidota bacterium]